MKPFFLALATFIGTTVGVGLFGLPYVAAKAGFLVVIFYFVVIGFLVSRLQLMYAELSIQANHGEHQLPGYTEIFLGKKYKPLAMLSLLLSIYGAILAYIIIGGEFLFSLLSPLLGGSLLLYQIIFFLVGIFLIHKGIESVVATEFIMLTLLILLILILALVSAPQINPANLQTSHLKHFFLPYGVTIFSLWGINIIPSLKEMVNRDAKKLKTVLTVGILSVIGIYILFVLSVVGVTGPQTSIDGLSGLVPVFSSKILGFGYFFGVLTTFTSFIALGVVMQGSFMHDYAMPRELSWFFTVFIPLTIFSLGVTNFLRVINITGAFMLAVQGIIIVAIYRTLLKKKKKLTFKISKIMTYCVGIILTLGIITEIFFTLAK